jgi:uncharacterized protein YceK
LRQFIILFTISFTIFSGCSSHFDRYTLSAEDEKATTSYKNVRLLDSDNKSKTIMSTIYLNDIYPNYTDGLAHFLISFYNPEHDNILYFNRGKTPSEQEYVLLLNGEDALASEELDSDDLLVDLMPISSSWNRYYYVRYKLPSGKPVLVLESDHTERAVITYQKAQE